MKKLMPIVAALALAGCARFSTHQTDTSYDDAGKPQRSISTKASAYTIFSSRSELTNWKASQTDKTQGASVGTLNQESSGTNAVAAINALANLLNSIKGF